MSSPSLSYKEIAPAGGGKVEKLVILLHGVSTDADDILMLAKVLPPQKNVQFVAPNAPHAYDNKAYPDAPKSGGHQWFSLQQKGERKNLTHDPERMLAEIRETAPTLNRFIDEQMERFHLSPKDVVLVGLSQGAMMALHVGPRREEPLGGIISMAGAAMGHETLAGEIKSHPPVYFVHGENDDVVPYSEMQATKGTYAAAGLSTTSHPIANLGHAVDGEMVKTTEQFLREAFTRTPKEKPATTGVKPIAHTPPAKPSKSNPGV